MATVAEILVRALMGDTSDDERARLDVVANHFGEQMRSLAIGLVHIVDAVRSSIVQTAEQAENGHERQGRLRLYRQRRSWKKADLGRLRTYQLSKAALNRVVQLKASKRVGRGTAVAYVPLAEQLVAAGNLIIELQNPATSPTRRLRLLKQRRWWPEFVEMTYRGEHLKLKGQGVKGPAAQAEERVAAAFCISVPTLRRLCLPVRRDARAGMVLSAPMDVEDLEVWMRCGRLPEPPNGEASR